MNAMTVPPMSSPAMPQNQEQEGPGEAVDIPQQQDAEPRQEEMPAVTAAETEPGGGAGETGEPAADGDEGKEPAADAGETSGDRDEKEEKEDKDEKKTAAKPKRKSAPRKTAGGSKTLVVLKGGRVQYADTDAVVVVDLDEAASPDTDVHDVLDRLTELRDATESPAKTDAVRALTDLIQEKALG
ncbi:hypothetical protein Caci_0105 [Catenulispora acidiphila DSM 44928]|uniref:Uncharacterized protein n=1 Tax=Catenulispora acidiphila (strain DSM 44928 / JCM 14897 / NBRC 102108 / NRRL B-24433 / ID139908) TaxID=479433 RepID=C7QHC1_CATAD|nr:hypothetical protein [Catenulispora acidiphila]ACU69060.1 hypothetical protein Caci_0105 [Catenulispora acidiphila DSM 44928]